MNIYVGGCIAYETTRKLYEEHKAELEARFPAFFLREFENLTEGAPSAADFLGNLCIEKNTQKNYSNGKYYFDGEIYVREIRDGGLFGALWAACEDLVAQHEALKNADDAFLTEGDFSKILQSSAIGCEIYLDRIPLDQHVVEVLEYRKESPYEVPSAGSYLVVCEEQRVPRGKNGGARSGDEIGHSPLLTKIGEITSARDRVILYGDSRRFLTPPSRQKKDIADRRGHEDGAK